MAKVFFWTAGTSDACTFYRCAEPGRVLRALGHDVTWHQQAGLADLMMADVVVIQRPTEGAPQHVMAKLLALPEGKRPRIVVELDDDLFSLPEHHVMHAALADPARRHRLTEAIANADRVTVTNEHLAHQIHQVVDDFAQDVRVVPNYVPERFVVAKVPELGPIGTPVITWAGSDTHRRDFDLVAVALRKMLRERNDFRVRIVGAPYADRLYSAAGKGRAILKDRIAQVPWIEGVERYIPTLAGHIGLAPLADDLFNRSKSDLRLKELAARGMAVVSSVTGPYADSAVPRMLAHDGVVVAGWEDVLRMLLDYSSDRIEHQVMALRWAQRNTLEAHADEWAKALLD